MLLRGASKVQAINMVTKQKIRRVYARHRAF